MNTIVRAFVVALALTGAVATTHTSSSAASATHTVTKASAMPIPTCPPDDPDACGLGKKY